MTLEGLQLGRYYLLRLLGIGGLSEVYQAEDVLTGEQVAIKLIHAEDTSQVHGHEEGEAYHFFLREATAIANLDHPHILPLYKYGEITVESSSFFYLVMPLCQKGTLAKWLERRGKFVQLPELDVAHFVCQAASALQYAHDNDIIHQDVKPSNFLLCPGKEHPYLPDLLLADFGSAEFINATTANLAKRTIRATPAYMAPERIAGHLGRSSDQYSLGVMAYQMLTAHLPFPAQLEQNISFRAQPQAPGTLNPTLSKELDEVVLRALARQPQDRYPTIAAFAQAFQEAVQSKDTSISIVTDTSYEPAGKEITATLAISEAEAIQGTVRTLVLSGGQHISISIPPGTRNGQVIRLEGQFQLDNNSKQMDALIITIAVTRVGDDELTLYSDNNAMTIHSGLLGKFNIPAVINQPRSRNLSWVRNVMFLALALLLMVVTVDLILLAQQNRGGINFTAPSPVAAAIDPYTHKGTLKLVDPLSDNSQGHSWQENASTGGAACRFTGGAYHVLQPQKGHVQTCFAQSTDFGNFVYEAQLTILKGDYGGVVFCADSANLKYYYFSIGRDGSFYFSRFVDGDLAHALVLLQGQAPFIQTDVNQANLLAVVVQNGSIGLYVNQQKIGSYDDSSYTHGKIGVFAGNAGNSTDIVFSQVKVWQF